MASIDLPSKLMLNLPGDGYGWRAKHSSRVRSLDKGEMASYGVLLALAVWRIPSY